MNSRHLPVFFAVLLCLLLAAPALAFDEARLKAQVQELLDRAAQGFMKKDMALVAATIVPQATIKYRDGRGMGMDQWREMVAKELADWRDVHSKFVVEKVWPKGKGQAGALYSESHQFSRLSDPGRKYAIKARFRVLLTKTAQGWQAQEFTDLGTRFLRDGKPLSPQAKTKKTAKAVKTQG